MECSRKGCEQDADGIPVLLLRATRKGVAAEAEMDLHICSGHILQSTYEDFITDEGWDSLASVFVSKGLARPVRAYTGLIWRAIN